MNRRMQQRLSRVLAALVLSFILAASASSAPLDSDPDPNYKPNGGTGDGPPPGDGGEGGDADEILIRARPGQGPAFPGIDAQIEKDQGDTDFPSWLERLLDKVRGSF